MALSPSSNSNKARFTIELFCKILKDNGISDVRAETLRQAKFNRDVSTKLMLKVLFDVVCYLEKPSANYLLLCEAKQLLFVKIKLQNWGYLCKAFAELPSTLTYGSREMLLALGWVIHTQRFFDKVTRRRVHPLHQDIMSFTEQKVLVDASNYPKRFLDDLSLKEKLQRQLLLCGKLKLKLRRLYACKQDLAHLRQNIQKYTLGVSVQPELNHLTPLEVFLIRYPDSMSRMLQILEDDNVKLKRLVEWKEKEFMFWEWMDSILTLQIQEKGMECYTPHESAGEESVFLNVPRDIREQICNVRACLRDFILSHEGDIEAVEHLIANKKISRGEFDLVKYQVEKELAELSQKFSQCERGNCDHPVRNSSLHEESLVKANGVLSSTVYSCDNAGRRNQRYLPQTALSIKIRKEAELDDMVQDKISALQREVDKLEQELKQAQVNNLKRLQIAAGKNMDSICILPRYFKQFLQN